MAYTAFFLVTMGALVSVLGARRDLTCSSLCKVLPSRPFSSIRSERMPRASTIWSVSEGVTWEGGREGEGMEEKGGRKGGWRRSGGGTHVVFKEINCA